MSAAHAPIVQLSSDFLRQALDESPDQIYAIDTTSGRILECNASATRALGYSRHELCQLSIRDIDTGFSDEFYRVIGDHIAEQRRDLVLRSRHRRADGSTFPVELRARPATLGGKRCTMAVVRDVTAQVELEDALRQSQRQYETLVRNLPGVVHRCLLDGTTLWIDERIEDLTGVPALRFMDRSRSLLEFMDEDDRRKVAAAVERSAQDGGNYDLTLTFTRTDGERRIVREVGHVVHPEGGGPPLIEGILFDVTDRAEQERVLREAFLDEHRRFEQVVKASRQVVYEVDVSRGSMLFSGSLKEVFGYSPESHGTTASDWQNRVHPDDRERVRAHSEQVVASGVIDIEYRYRHADGSYRWVWDRGICEFDADGTPGRIVGMMQDITTRKELEAQISAAQRMETVGSLAGGVAHDVNNYLTTILGNLDVALMRVAEAGDWPELTDAREAAFGCANLVRNLLTFARQSEAVRERLEPLEVLQDTLRMLQRLAGPDIELTAYVDPACPAFEADRVQVQQVLMNLVANARDAMARRGAISIEFAPACVHAPGEADTRPAVRIRVRDNGPGVPEALRDRIFEPFFTTHGVGEGTGLGLSIVHGIATSYGGRAELEESETGASFAVYLPALGGTNS